VRLRLGIAASALRLTRGTRLVTIVASLNRSMTALGARLARRHFGFVLLLTLAVTSVGAAAILAFENTPGGEQRLDSYGTALWWTAMIMTTMGSELWPRTPEGRLLLALYAFTVFGYVTAMLASFFLGQDRADAAQGDE